ncbi:MAG: hypothetical protein IPI81_06010 [Flavobacteriales bacterium]|nr:hypothetical protein [Flavobacteriales bacterium]
MRNAPIAGGRSRWIVMCVILIWCGSVLAQPPIVVDWIQDQLLWDNWVHGVRTSDSGSTTMYVGGDPVQEFTGCGTYVVGLSFSASGEPQYPMAPSCIEIYGISQQFCAWQQGVLVCMDIGVPTPTVWVSGIHYSSFPTEAVAMNSGPDTYSVTDYTRHALLVSGGNFFLGGGNGIIGGNEYDCLDRIWKTPYPTVDLGTSWTACMDNHFVTFEIWNDTLLAIGFPTVTKVDTTNGTQSGTFDLFSGSSVNNGYTAISGDTLFWASRLSDGQLHVGRYLLGSGPIWEVTLPFSGNPVKLHRDAYGRLWTASGNNIVWLDQSDGSYQSYSIGQVVKGMDMVGRPWRSPEVWTVQQAMSCMGM